MKAGRTDDRGFSLLEILVALAVLGIAATVAFQVFSASTKSLSDSEDYLAALVRAEAKMREVLDGEKLAADQRTEVTEDGYRIDVKVTEVMQARTEALPVQLFEVVLTLQWKKGLKERTIALASMKAMTRKI